jgi:hypothetical protein
MLVAQSDLQRQELLAQASEAQQEFAQIRKRFAIVGLSSVALGAGASIAKLFLGRNGAEEKSSGVGGWFSKLTSGVSLFRNLKSLLAGLKSGMGADEEQG